MFSVDAVLADCLKVPLVIALSSSIILLSRRRFGWLLLSLLATALLLTSIIVTLVRPIYEEADRECRFGGTNEQYVACKRAQQAAGQAPNTPLAVALVVVPTSLIVAGSLVMRQFRARDPRS